MLAAAAAFLIFSNRSSFVSLFSYGAFGIWRNLFSLSRGEMTGHQNGEVNLPGLSPAIVGAVGVDPGARDRRGPRIKTNLTRPTCPCHMRGKGLRPQYRPCRRAFLALHGHLGPSLQSLSSLSPPGDSDTAATPGDVQFLIRGVLLLPSFVLPGALCLDTSLPLTAPCAPFAWLSATWIPGLAHAPALPGSLSGQIPTTQVGLVLTTGASTLASASHGSSCHTLFNHCMYYLLVAARVKYPSWV